MPVPDDFINGPEAFMAANVVKMNVIKGGLRAAGSKAEVKHWAFTEYNNPVDNLPGANVYVLQDVAVDAPGAFRAYYCPFALDDWQYSMLGNDALFMFTDRMNGCTFGVGSQGAGLAGKVLVCHLNMVSTSSTGGTAASGEQQQAKVQRGIFVGKMKKLGAGPGQIMEPPTYMGGAADQPGKKMATTFGFHARNNPWTFKSLAYRQAGSTHYHDGLKDTVPV